MIFRTRAPLDFAQAKTAPKANKTAARTRSAQRSTWLDPAMPKATRDTRGGNAIDRSKFGLEPLDDGDYRARYERMLELAGTLQGLLRRAANASPSEREKLLRPFGAGAPSRRRGAPRKYDEEGLIRLYQAVKAYQHAHKKETGRSLASLEQTLKSMAGRNPGSPLRDPARRKTTRNLLSKGAALLKKKVSRKI